MKKRGKYLIYLLLSFASFFVGFPILWMIAMSVRPNTEIFTIPPSFIPRTFTLEPYISVLKNKDYLRFFSNSYVVALITVVFALLVAILAGYGFSRYEFKGKKFLIIFIIAIQTIPPITMLIPYFSMIVYLKIYDTLLGLIVTYTSFCLPYAILMLTGYFNTIPKELDEAVLIDGGSRFYLLFYVLLPIAVPGLIATAVYTFLLCWNEFLFALTLTKSISVRTIPVGISLLMGQQVYQWNQIMSTALIGSFPIICLYLFAQKYFISGLSAGSIKG